MLHLTMVPPRYDAADSFTAAFTTEVKPAPPYLNLPSARHNERDRTAFDDLRKVFTVIRLDEVSAYLRGNATSESQISRVPLLQLFSDSRDCQYRDTVILPQIDELA